MDTTVLVAFGYDLSLLSLIGITGIGTVLGFIVLLCSLNAR